MPEIIKILNPDIKECPLKQECCLCINCHRQRITRKCNKRRCYWKDAEGHNLSPNINGMPKTKEDDNTEYFMRTKGRQYKRICNGAVKECQDFADNPKDG